MNADDKPLALAIGALFILAFVPVLAGGVMFSGRKQLGWAVAQSRRYLYWERSLWIAAMVLLTAGSSLFAELLQAQGEHVFSRLGETAFLFGALVIAVAEAYALDTQSWASYMVRLAVVLLFVAQALLGGAALHVAGLPQWIGWATIIWNVGALALLVRAKDPYFPAVHYLMPLITGMTLISLAG
jgi:hypothetical protein